MKGGEGVVFGTLAGVEIKRGPGESVIGFGEIERENDGLGCRLISSYRINWQLCAAG